MSRSKRKSKSRKKLINFPSMYDASLFDLAPITLAAPAKSFEGRTLVGKFLLLGGGLQSGCMVEMILAGELPKPDAVVFADTGDEPFWVEVAILRWQRRLEKLGIPIILTAKHEPLLWPHRDSLLKRVMRGAETASLPLFTYNPVTRKRGRLKRQCTSDYKVAPTNKVIRQWLLMRDYASVTHKGEWTHPMALDYDRSLGRPDPLWFEPELLSDSDDAHIRVKSTYYVECWFGITTDEGFRADPYRGLPWQKAVYPLIDMEMTRDDCERWLRERGLSVPLKSACFFCPYKSDASWLWLKENAPDLFELACQFDDWLRSPEIKLHPTLGTIRDVLYLHHSCKPLREVDFAATVRQHNQLKVAIALESCSTDGAWSCMS